MTTAPTSLEGRTVVVTGGAGFIGSHLVDELLARGASRVRVVDNLENGTRENLQAALTDDRTDLLVADIRDAAAMRAATAEADVVFHLACLGVRHSLRKPFVNHEVNATGTLTLLEAAREADVARFVHVSTSEVFGTARHVPMDEEHPTWPETVYGGSKLAGEAYARAYHRTHGFPVVVVRPFNTYGPRSHYAGDSGEVLPRTVVRMLGGQRPVVFGDGEQTRDFMYVADTARAIAMLGTVAGIEGETFNLGTGSEVSLNQIIEVVGKATGRQDLPAVHLDARPGDVRRLHGSPDKLRRLTGFEAEVEFQHGVAELVAWFRTRPEPRETMLARIADRNWLPEETTEVQ